MRVSFISSFVPRKCGVATYSRDLYLELKKQHSAISVVAMENPHVPTRYSSPVVQTISQEKIENYKKAGEILNASSAEIIHLQHEFGLFGGQDGEYILRLIQELTKSLIVTFHTVLLTPTEHQKYIIQELARSSRKIVVMDEIAKSRLEQVYALDSGDIEIIPHGAPSIDITKELAKKSAHFPNDKFILLASNLLSRNKGIEYAIEAVASAIKRIPNLLFLIVGETHPLVKFSEGESYREELMQLVKKLNLEKYVIFKNEYVTLNKLQITLAAADVYISPYLDPQQIASGTLAYAIGAGKACIATKYVYAEDLLADGRGILVPFRDSKAIANALIRLYEKPAKRRAIEKKTQLLGKEMLWPNVAKKHIELYTKVLEEDKNISEEVRKFLAKRVNISYLSHLTDSIGLVQHAYRTIPNRKFGYSTDDNARALIVVSQLYRRHKTPDLMQLIKLYVGFLQFAQEPDGKFHSFLNNGNWVDKEDISDPYGKALWALGYNLYITKNNAFTRSMQALFSLSLEQLNNVRDLRTIAYSLLGLYYYIKAYETKSDVASMAIRYVKKLADFLIENYEKTSDNEWKWFEDVATYDNFRLPQALFAAYMVTRNKRYKEVALSTLDFITRWNFNEKKGYFDFIGQNGWLEKGKDKAEYDQQPLEAAAAVEAYMFAAKALNKKTYKEKALLAFEWFFGRNRNHRNIYDNITKGVHDGLTSRGINENEGAESIVCFLMANISLKDIRKEI